jgi:hypothetical protein
MPAPEPTSEEDSEGWSIGEVSKVALLLAFLSLAFYGLAVGGPWPTRNGHPLDCEATPRERLEGAVVSWNTTDERGANRGGKYFALVELNDKQSVVASSTRKPVIKVGDTIQLARFACTGRSLYLIEDQP